MTEIMHKLSTRRKRGNQDLLNMANCNSVDSTMQECNAKLLNVQIKRHRPGNRDNTALVVQSVHLLKYMTFSPRHSHCSLKLLSCFSSDERRDPATRRSFGVFISRRRYLCSLSKLFLQREKKRRGLSDTICIGS